MRSVTIGVSNMDAALQIFHDVMGLAIEQRFPLTAARRAAWGLPPETRGDLVELSCQGYPIGRIRLLALDPRPREYVRLDPLMAAPMAHSTLVSKPSTSMLQRRSTDRWPSSPLRDA